MLVKITSKRQVTFPTQVLDTLGLKPGDLLELLEDSKGILLRPHRVDATRLAPLRDKLRRGRGSFDLDSWREQPHDPALRD